MIRTLSINPYIGIELAMILQTALLIHLVLREKGFEYKIKLFESINIFWKEFFSGLYIIFGFLFIDIAVWWLIGSWTWMDWRIQLPSVILILIIGVEYVYLAAFQKRDWARIGLFVVTAIVLSLFIHWWVPIDPVMVNRMKDGIYYAIGVLLLITFLIATTRSIIFLKSPRTSKVSDENSEMSETIQDQGLDNKKVILFNAVIWVFAFIQAILFFSGYSLFSFL